MHHTVLAAGSDVSADDVVVVDQQRRKIHAVRAGVVGDLVDIAREGFSAVGKKIVALRQLQIVIPQEHLRRIFGHTHLLGLHRLLRYCPAELLQKRHARFIGRNLGNFLGGVL